MPVPMPRMETPTEGVRFTLRHLPSVSSTNDFVLDRIDALPDGTVVIADLQSAGRGRLGRSWHSPSGNLYMTVLLKAIPRAVEASGAGGLTLLAALAVCHAMEIRRLSPRIKWPNDVLVDDRKIAGILAEGAWQDGRLAWVAVGMGVNLNMSLQEAARVDRPIAVMAHELGAPVDQEDFVRDLLGALDGLLRRASHGGLADLHPEIHQRVAGLGSLVSVETPQGVRRGKMIGIDDAGFLLLEEEQGSLQRIGSGVMTC